MPLCGEMAAGKSAFAAPLVGLLGPSCQTVRGGPKLPKLGFEVCLQAAFALESRAIISLSTKYL